jgi:Flp pilus assembly protein TadG
MRPHNRLLRKTTAVRQAIRDFMVGADGIAGAALLEFAVVAPVIVMISIYVMDFGLFTVRKMQVQHAAQMGAQYAAANGYSSASISSAVTNDSNGSTFAISASPAPTQFCACASSGVLTTATCKSTCSDGSAAGTYVTVSASATYNMLIVPVHGKLFPLKLSASYPLAASATVRIQ